MQAYLADAMIAECYAIMADLMEEDSGNVYDEEIIHSVLATWAHSGNV